MVSAQPICSFVRVPARLSDRSRAMISRAFSGVRSSWLMLATNSDL